MPAAHDSPAYRLRHRLAAPPLHHRPRRPRGFTLVELLVCIIVLALLLALLLPALSGARKASQSAVCLSNLHQLGVACSGYVAANKDTYQQPVIDPNIPAPARETGMWFNALDDFLDRPSVANPTPGTRNEIAAKQDPVWSSFSAAATPPALSQRELNHTIKMNGFLGPNPGVHWTRTSELREIDRMVIFADGWAQDLYPQLPTGAGEIVTCFHLVGFHDNGIRPGLRHNGSANVQFADGHGRTERQAVMHITPDSGNGLPPGNDYAGWYPEGHPNQKLRWTLGATGITVTSSR